MIKKRNMLGQIGLIIITFGIYGIYWFYKISEEMKYVGKDMEASPALWTVLLFVPFAGLWSYYKFSELYEKVSPDPSTNGSYGFYGLYSRRLSGLSYKQK